MPTKISLADLEHPDFIDLINTHASLMLSLSPPDSCHYLPIEGLKSRDVTVWDLRDDGILLGCGALKQLSQTHGEIKSMHTRTAQRGRGLGRTMLEHIMQTARTRGYERLSLETGSMDSFIPARRLYEAYRFKECGPFGDYKADPNSLFMTLEL